jgi:halocyanin-like protein
MKGLVSVVEPVSPSPGPEGTPAEDTPSPSRNLDAPEEVKEYLANVSNARSVTDRTGQNEVTVTVGAEGNGGTFAFSPAVLRIDAGTTVVWEWAAKGGSHDVTAEDGSFQSELTHHTDTGHTFEQTFDSPGVVLYHCRPHEALGMKGAIIVE